MQNREDCRRVLTTLALPSIALSIFDGKVTHEALRYRCQSPYHVFAAPVEIPGGDVTPLWECGVDLTAYQYSRSAGRFIRVSLESPEEIRVIGSAFAIVVADLLSTLWEDEVPEADLREIARSFGFDHVERLLADLDATPRALSVEQHRQWLSSVLSPYERTA